MGSNNSSIDKETQIAIAKINADKETQIAIAIAKINADKDKVIAIAKINADKETQIAIAKINADKETQIAIAKINAGLLQLQGNIIFHYFYSSYVKHYNISKELRPSIDFNPSVFVIAVLIKGKFQLSGNAFAITPNKVVTSFHNLYDDDDESDLHNHTNESNLTIYQDAIICQKVTKNAEKQPVYYNPILVKLFDHNYRNDWAVLEVVKGNTIFSDQVIQDNPVDMEFLRIYPYDVNNFFRQKNNELKVHYYDIGLFNSSNIEGEELTCQRYDYRRVCFFNESNNTFRVQDGLGKGSSGCPYINKLNMVVAMHTSLDSSLQRESTVNELIEKNARKRRRKGSANQQEISNSENISVLSEISSIAGSFTSYKEGFALCTDEQFKRHLIEE
jgi:hypothetical protein